MMKGMIGRTGLSGSTSISSSMTEQSSSRKSKACDNCRIRRVKCSGDWPCKPCINLGLQSDCKVRVKARPKRALAKGIAPREAEMEGEESVGLDIIKAIEDRTRVWIRDRGGSVNIWGLLQAVRSTSHYPTFPFLYLYPPRCWNQTKRPIVSKNSSTSNGTYPF